MIQIHLSLAIKPRARSRPNEEKTAIVLLSCTHNVVLMCSVGFDTVGSPRRRPLKRMFCSPAITLAWSSCSSSTFARANGVPGHAENLREELDVDWPLCRDHATACETAYINSIGDDLLAVRTTGEACIFSRSTWNIFKSSFLIRFCKAGCPLQLSVYPIVIERTLSGSSCWGEEAGLVLPARDLVKTRLGLTV